MNILDKYGNWTVLDKTPISDKGRLWLKCQCACGIEKNVRLYSLQRGLTNQCRKCCGKQILLSDDFKDRWKGKFIGDLGGTMYLHIRNKARERDMDFNLNQEFLWKLMIKQNHKCALSGQSIKLSRKIIGSHHDTKDTTASLDRIDSLKGYIPSNVQWVHKHINLMKNVLNQEYFIEMCKKVANKCSVK